MTDHRRRCHGLGPLGDFPVKATDAVPRPGEAEGGGKEFPGPEAFVEPGGRRAVVEAATQGDQSSDAEGQRGDDAPDGQGRGSCGHLARSHEEKEEEAREHGGGRKPQ